MRPLFICIIFLLSFPGNCLAQSAREKEWQHILTTAETAFIIKKQEKGLSGQQLKNQLLKRSKAFGKASAELSMWIDKYYPNGDQYPTSGYVQAFFTLALYTEYRGDYKTCLGMHMTICEYLVKLDNTGQSIPKYNDVGVDKWVMSKIKTLNKVVSELDARQNEFDFTILQSAESIQEYITKRVNFLIDDATFAEFVSGNKDEFFSFNEFLLQYADSVALTNFGKWSELYFEGLLQGLNIPHQKDSTEYFQLWLVDDTSKISNEISDKLYLVFDDFHRKYYTDDSIITVSIFLQNAEVEEKLDSLQLSWIFGENSLKDVNYFLSEKWGHRISYIGEPIINSDAPLITELILWTTINWILADFTQRPPNWLSGLAHLYSDGSTSNDRKDSEHLYYLKAALVSEKLPKIEEMLIPNDGEQFSFSMYNFSIAYYRYFCWFLERQRILPSLYEELQNSSDFTNESSVDLIQKLSEMDLSALNKSFQEFIISKDIYGIPADKQFMKITIEDEVRKLFSQ
jgi:hypothetical protein